MTPLDRGFYPAARQSVIDMGIVRRRKVDVASDIPARRKLFDNRWSLAREKTAADLEAADQAPQRVGERARLRGRIDVEGH